MYNSAKLNNSLRPIEIGDYADIPFNKPEDKEIYGSTYGFTYRFHIIKIKHDFITIAEIENSENTHILSKNADGLWQEVNGNIATFSKNGSSTEYLERDYTLAPTKITKISDAAGDKSFAELPNGVILYQYLEGNTFLTRGIFGFYDRSYHTTFLNMDMFDPRVHYDIMNLDGEIFIASSNTDKIEKFNLNDFTITKYDKNAQYDKFYPLIDKKVLCLLRDKSMYILDLTKKTDNRKHIIFPKRTHLIYTSIRPDVHQLSNGDIILNESNPIGHGAVSNIIYRININDGILTKLATFSYGWLSIIAILPDVKTLPLDKVLSVSETLSSSETLPTAKALVKLYDRGKDTPQIQIWDLNADPTGLSKEYKIADILFNDVFGNNSSIGEVLPNGDVLFNDKGSLYLYEDYYRIIRSFYSIDGYISNFKLLKDGNLIIDAEGLTILEFPINQKLIDRRNYDKITLAIKLNSDMVALIRDYL